jgi:hypothetical protein
LYDSEEQELGDLCAFYAEQEDFNFDDKSTAEDDTSKSNVTV